MGFFNVKDIFSSDQITGSTDSDAIGIHHSTNLRAEFVYTNDTPGSAETGSTGKVEVQTATFPAKAGATAGDYFVVYDTAGLGWAAALTKQNGTADVKTVTFPAKAGATTGDYIVIKDVNGLSWAAGLQKVSGTQDVKTVTFPAKAGATDGDFIVVKDTNGVSWLIVLDKAGNGAYPNANGAVYNSIPSERRVIVNIASTTTAAQVAAAVELAVDALSGFTSVIVTDDSAGDGTMTFTSVAKAVVADYVPYNAAEDDVGSITVANTTPGVAPDAEPTGALWAAIPAARKVFVDISGTTTAASVAAAVETGVDALTGFSAVIVTDDTANDGTMTFTAQAVGVVSDYVPKNATDAGAGSITVANTTPGVAADSAPTGAIWSAIPSARKTLVDISGATDAASVAAAVETAFDALTSVPFTTDDTANDGTMIFTNTLRGNTAAASVKNADDSGAGSISFANTTAGVDSIVNATANTLTLTAHGYYTGLKGQISINAGSLPTGLTGSTDYFVIVVDANTVQLASSLANALAGTAIDLEDQGTADKTLTFTPTALAGGVCHLEGSLDKVNWFDIASKTFNITASGSSFLDIVDAAYMYVRANVTVTAGQLTISGKLGQKGPSQ